MSALSETAIVVSPEGCQGPVPFLWTEVRAVSVANRPAPDADVLALRFTLRDGRSIELSEEVPGFTQLVQFLPEVLPGFPEHDEWLYDAAGTAPNSETVLFEA